MDKLSLLIRLKELYLKKQNIIQYLKNLDNREDNTIEDIMISYDFQAGTYTESYKKQPSIYQQYAALLGKEINELGSFNSILEVGVGEATMLASLLSSLTNSPNNIYGFDISWSRIKYAKRFLNEMKIKNVNLFTGDLFCTPFIDTSIDIVYTSHSIEPNGGKEKEALIELYRITNKYLILLEPSYEFANDEARKRMLSHGYITKLYDTAISLGYNVITHKPFERSLNPLNPTGLIIIEKKASSQISNPLCCPITKTSLIKKNNAYFSEEGLIAYPILDEIPCLLSSNGIVATKFLDYN